MPVSFFLPPADGFAVGFDARFPRALAGALAGRADDGSSVLVAFDRARRIVGVEDSSAAEAVEAWPRLRVFVDPVSAPIDGMSAPEVVEGLVGSLGSGSLGIHKVFPGGLIRGAVSTFSALAFSFFVAQVGMPRGTLPKISVRPRMPVASQAFAHERRCFSQSASAAFIVL